MATITALPDPIEQGGRVSFTLNSYKGPPTDLKWAIEGVGPAAFDQQASVRAHWDVPEDQRPGSYTVQVTDSEAAPIAETVFTVTARPLGAGDRIQVRMNRTETFPTDDQALWTVIRASAERLKYSGYEDWIDAVMGAGELTDADLRTVSSPRRSRNRTTPFPGVDRYQLLKTATEVFLLANCGVRVWSPGGTSGPGDASQLLNGVNRDDEQRRHGGHVIDLAGSWRKYTHPKATAEHDALPYFATIYRKLGIPGAMANNADAGSLDDRLLREKMQYPFFLELIWSYWHEEGMLTHSIDAIARRFQNFRDPRRHDPLAHVEIDPLRGLNPLLWGYIQDEQHRLSALRRAHEYDHHYGFTQQLPRGVRMATADSRPRFLQAFHTLLNLASAFFKEDDDTTVIADGFPLLNALKDVHLLLTEGQHNQYGDLPWTARLEMLIQQYLLARPQMRDFLPGRTMVAYPETWMQPVDTMKRLQGWPSDSVIHFRDLGHFGEQLLLTIRFANWNSVNDRDQAANWARYWRSEIQGYMHSYRSVTGIDLSVERADSRIDATPPSVLLLRRLQEQTGVRAPAPTGAATLQRDGRTPRQLQLRRAELPPSAARRQPGRPLMLPPGGGTAPQWPEQTESWGW
ncbi:hypothetical protein [Streptomyces sp. NPDC001070]